MIAWMEKERSETLEGVSFQRWCQPVARKTLPLSSEEARGGAFSPFIWGLRGQQLAGADLHMTLSQEQSRGGDR